MDLLSVANLRHDQHTGRYLYVDVLLPCAHPLCKRGALRACAGGRGGRKAHGLVETERQVPSVHKRRLVRMAISRVRQCASVSVLCSRTKHPSAAD